MQCTIMVIKEKLYNGHKLQYRGFLYKRQSYSPWNALVGRVHCILQAQFMNTSSISTPYSTLSDIKKSYIGPAGCEKNRFP